MPQQGGFSLLEVLISSAVLATALLGLATLMMRGMEDAAASRFELAAAILLRDLVSRQQVAGETLDRPPAGSFLDQELSQWRDQALDSLPASDLAICRDGTPDDGEAGSHACDGSGALVVKLFWTVPLSQEQARRSWALQP